MSEDYKVQVSLALPPVGQYAKGDMVNFRGESVAEVEALLDSAIESLLEKAVDASRVYYLAYSLNQPEQPAQAAPAASQSAPDNVAQFPVRTCAHGKRTRRTGNGKRGPWVGYFCPLEKGNPDQCEPEWED